LVTYSQNNECNYPYYDTFENFQAHNKTDTVINNEIIEFVKSISKPIDEINKNNQPM
jgi:2-polyprenyl-3-methyl-5-hydroxy-6-metoxy-1,4-benzoquinol methylase